MMRWSRTRLSLRKEAGVSTSIRPFRSLSATAMSTHASPLPTVREFHRTSWMNNGIVLLGAGAITLAVYDSLEWKRICRASASTTDNCIFSTSSKKTLCDALGEEDDEGDPSGHSERERFLNGLQYHRSLLFDYVRRWHDDHSQSSQQQNSLSKIHNSITWPRNVPSADEIPALELDLRFCRMSPNYRNNAANCQNLQFRIAAFYVSQKNDPDNQRHGFKLLKDVANHGHPDAMCLYAIILNEGELPGVEANPEEAVVWWRRCVDLHRHITATYELAVAYYTGDGCSENPDNAVRLFRQGAHLGHAGAAYMLGECLLDGVGVARDRGAALEWLVTAAELGHHLARDRVIIVLNEDYESMDAGTVEPTTAQEELAEAQKWIGRAPDISSNIERRFTIGSSSEELVKRKTKVLESRDSS